MSIQFRDGEDQGINEINITPFVDIVLVLLIIFMISTPAMVHRGMRVNLPKVFKSEDLSHVTLKLMMAADGRLFIDRRQVSVDELKNVCRKLKESKADPDALVSADKDVPHGKVMEIAAVLKDSGIVNIGFATDSAGAKPGSK